MIYTRDRVPAQEFLDVDIPNGIECGIIEEMNHVSDLPRSFTKRKQIFC